MIRKNILIFVIVLIIVSLLLGGCTASVTTVTETKTAAAPPPSTTTTTATATVTAPPETVTTTATVTAPPVTVTATETAPPETVTVTATVTPAPVETPTETPTPTPMITPTFTPGVNAVTLTDPTGDLFDAVGMPTTDQPYLDIIGAELYIDGSDYVARITVNADIPAFAPDEQTFYEWDVYVDVDKNADSGEQWDIVHPGLGPEYFARFGMLGSIVATAEIRNLNTDRNELIDYVITGNVIELRWRTNFYPTASFNFIVAAKKYLQQGAEEGFQLADRAPNTVLAEFPAP